MDLNILSLPPEILAKIFSNIPWNKLINVKLAARDFNYVTEKYHKHMQKPKLYEIFFEDDRTGDDGIDRIKIIYSIYIAGGNGDNTDEKEFIFPSSELYQLHRFLQKVDLTSLNNVDNDFCNNTEVIRIFSGYFHNTNRIETMCVAAGGSVKDLGNTLPLLEKIQKVRDLKLFFYFSHKSVPGDFIIPVRDSLEILEIIESKDTNIINPRMIKFIVENNPNLSKYLLKFDDFQTYKMVIGTIVKEELARRNNGCSHKSIVFYLDISNFEGISELLSYFNSEELPYNDADTIPDDYFLYLNELECPVCGEFDKILIVESE
uniref:F-box domain-containing protein n=1 Tax=Strongyloides papillosus TaxID=174720 RepID=A0A0N5BKJ2_STREA